MFFESGPLFKDRNFAPSRGLALVFMALMTTTSSALSVRKYFFGEPVLSLFDILELLTGGFLSSPSPTSDVRGLREIASGLGVAFICTLDRSGRFLAMKSYQVSKSHDKYVKTAGAGQIIGAALAGQGERFVYFPCLELHFGALIRLICLNVGKSRLKNVEADKVVVSDEFQESSLQTKKYLAAPPHNSNRKYSKT